MTHGIEIIKRMNEEASHEPKPTGTEKRVCDDIANRQVKGVSKYGTTVEECDLSQRQWLRHAYEEALDMAIYLRRTIEDADKTASQPPKPTGTAEAAVKAASFQRANKRCLEPGELTREGDTYIDAEGRHQLFGPTGWVVVDQEVYRDISSQHDTWLAKSIKAIDEGNLSEGDYGYQAALDRIIAAVREVEGLRTALNDEKASRAECVLEIERLKSEVEMSAREVEGVNKMIQHCDNCGGSWLDDGLTAGCRCKLISELRKERDEAREKVEALEAERHEWNVVQGQMQLDIDRLKAERDQALVDKQHQVELAMRQAVQIDEMNKLVDQYRDKANRMRLACLNSLSAWRLMSFIEKENESIKQRISELEDATSLPPSEPDAPTDAPDPGEGWEACNARDAEQNWNSTGGKWMHGQCYGGFNRRRIVMSEPPSEDAVGDNENVWIFQWTDKFNSCDWSDDSGEFCRAQWKSGRDAVIAWCHRLPGEDEPPQMLKDWKPEEKVRQRQAEPLTIEDKPTEPTTQRREGWENVIGLILDTPPKAGSSETMATVMFEDGPRSIPTPEEVAELKEGSCSFAGITACLGLLAGSLFEEVNDRGAALQEEIAKLRRSKDRAEQWYAVRWARLKDHIEGSKESEAFKAEASCIMANGVADTFDPPTYDQKMQTLRHEVERLRRERDELRMELITSHGETQTALEERDALQARVDAAEEVAKEIASIDTSEDFTLTEGDLENWFSKLRGEG